MAYIPGQIVTGVTNVDRSSIKIDNKHDHVTMLLGGLQAQYSNNLLEQLNASSTVDLQSLPAGDVVVAEVSVKDYKGVAFYTKLKHPLVIQTVAKRVY